MVILFRRIPAKGYVVSSLLNGRHSAGWISGFVMRKPGIPTAM
jgi:hypothetical protein